ncbi:hypothetical protein [uncultured Aeromicrobium sp.]|uniref:hypothetical protein n=1 Tax=uncultured Aeromicrobium sp. TaxID=337820 RepID=UPI0025FB63A5|nr:hypothetical protein [uncultured Aeromicrobium sp.]
MLAAIKVAGTKPDDDASSATKKNYNERLSAQFALAIAAELRRRGMKEARPSTPGDIGLSGAERRLAGGIGAKKVDVTWATEESGLILACSVKTILFKDSRTRNYQKNLTNRRGDLLIEAVTLHRRFPYAVLAGFLFLDVGAASDGTDRRRSTFHNAFPRLRLFTRRPDPSGRDEQFERLYLLLVDSNPFAPSIRAFEVNDHESEVDLDDALDDIIELIGERNFDIYDGSNGQISRL